MNKTKPEATSVHDFLTKIENESKRNDSIEICELMSTLTKADPVMWGTSIIGFDSYHYKYASGREGDWMKIGFSPRKTNLTLYIMPGFSAYDDLLSKLGKHKTGKSCLYIKKLNDIDRSVLKTLIRKSITYMNKKYD